MNEQIKIWLGSFIRGLVVAGLTIFSLSIIIVFFLYSFESALITCGVYMFLELAKYYGIPANITPKDKKAYKYLLFP